MKKAIMILMLGLALLAGCSQDDKKPAPEQSQSETAPATPAAPAEKPAQ